MDRVSYSLGVTVGANLKMNGVDSLDPNLLAAAIKDIYSSAKPLISQDSAKDILDSYFMKLKETQSQKTKSESGKFFTENKKKPGITELPSGLQYQVLKQGTGPKPTAEDTVTVHYTGKLIDGTVFDSSVERNEPATFPVGMVIPGWTEALQLMSVGSKWVLYIPSQLGYGEHGAGGVIPPSATLIFEVELLSISGR
ncbi:MAG: peptidylprolyl isomerase [Bacteroidetes bacterium RIFCSPLOWO2_12_FULL_31_6]|nr:MAG: peptidylprolyl isomerase [Bacteroidetes bacterium RIFCSPLOWO2_12_FULL_31_6]